MKNIIITSGGTSEPIDSVRKITNSSSGKLGALICERIPVTLTGINNIYYICARKSILPARYDGCHTIYVTDTHHMIIENIFASSCETNIYIVYADSTQEIFDAMKLLLTDSTKNITHVIHARAIADYMVDYVTSSRKLDEAFHLCDEYSLIRDALQEKKDHDIFIDNSNKISSTEDDLFIRLIKTPKIINYIKQWNSNVVLIGFKLLDNVPVEELFAAAKHQMEVNSCDYVLANDLSQINDTQHHAYLIGKTDTQTLETKNQIAEAIVKIINE